jgi:negative regulator of flagellin synthesis FlgM
MKITHNKVGQNVNVTDAKSEKTSGAANAAGVKKNSKASESPAADAAVAGSQAAKVELSSRAQDVRKIKELATAAPDVDAAKVEKFRKMIADGTYKVDAKAIADKMVDEHLMAAGKTSNE